MEPRTLKRLLELPKARRNEVVAEGLDRLGHYLERLQLDAQWLHDDGRNESAAIVDLFAAELAASSASSSLISAIATGRT